MINNSGIYAVLKRKGNNMALKFLKHSSIPHAGYGAGWGTIDTDEYECPCGKGKVIRTKDNIPGFRDSDITIECDECSAKYGVIRSLSELK